MNTHRCLFNWVTHSSVIRFCEFFREVIASYTAKDKFSINICFEITLFNLPEHVLPLPEYPGLQAHV